MNKLNVSVIIPTYNRPEDLKNLLNSISLQSTSPQEVIVVDDSTNPLTQKVINSLNKRVGRKIIYRKKKPNEARGITTSRNIGFSLSHEEIISFLDDDVVLDKFYFSDLVKFYEDNPSAKGVCFVEPSTLEIEKSKFKNFFMKIFSLGYSEPNRCRVLPSMIHTNPNPLTRKIGSEFLSGENFSFRREVLDKLKFDQNLVDYSPQEDLDFSYRVHKEFKQLYLVPKANHIHKVSPVARMPTKRLVYHRFVYLAYLFRKNTPQTPKNQIIFWWSMFGRIFLRTLDLVSKPEKGKFVELKYLLLVTFSILSHFEILKFNPNYFKKDIKDD